MIQSIPDFLVVIPVRNEAASLPGVVDELRRVCRDVPILVVDDRSEDATPALLAGLDVRWLRLDQHLGIGGAMRAGLRFARLLGHRVVVRVDGDGQHRPEDIAGLLAPIRGGAVDAVQGSRYVEGGGYRAQGARRLGQRALGAVLSRLTAQPVTDPTSGFWAFGPRAVAMLGDAHPSGYPEPELRIVLHRNRLCVAETPIVMRPRLAGRTSLTAPRTGMAMARLLLTTVVAPLRPVVKAATR